MGILDKLKPEPRIWGVLEADHRAVDAMFAAILASDDPTERRRIFEEQLLPNLESHAFIEQQLLYSRIRNAEKTRDVTLEADEEHKIVTRLLREINAMSSAGDVFIARVTVLKELVHHHVREEEREMFRKAKWVISDEEALALAEEFTSRRTAYMERMKKPAASKSSSKRRRETQAEAK